MQGKIRTINNLLLKRELSAVEITKKYIEYSKKLNESLNAYINTTYQSALEKAENIDNCIKNGEAITMLSGIPMSVKDVICTRDVETTCGSKMLLRYKPIFDAFAVECLDSDGAVMIAKTNMDEFAMGSTGESSYFGATKNPYNLNCVTGGSSSGSAASVASDMSVFSLGSDTGGSVRQPASFCGCVGLKPTYGAISRFGLIAHASSFDTIGIIAQSVEDTAIVFDSVNLYDKRDSTCINYEREKIFGTLNGEMNGLKIGVLSDLFKNLDIEIENAIKSSLRIFESLGAKISEISVRETEFALPVYYILCCAEASSNLARYDGVRYGYRADNFLSIDEMICKTRNAGFGEEVKRRIMVGNYVLSSGYFEKYYSKAQKLRKTIEYKFRKLFDEYDILIAPTATSTAFEIGQFSGDPVSMYETDICTVIANICGMPALSIPCGYDKDGMPIGMQIIGNKFSENIILNSAFALESELESKLKKPKIGGDCLGI